MKIVMCLDKNLGMCFNRRRLSKDRVVTEKILALSSGGMLWIHPFSAGLFEGQNVQSDEGFLYKAGTNDYCFVENQSLKEVEGEIEELIIFWWDRDYPSDLKLDLELSRYRKTGEEEFPGYSHERIIKEVYRK